MQSQDITVVIDEKFSIVKSLQKNPVNNENSNKKENAMTNMWKIRLPEANAGITGLMAY